MSDMGRELILLKAMSKERRAALLKAIVEAIPVCPIHKSRMTPVSRGIHGGETTETDYACTKCIEELAKDEPIYLSSGPIMPYYLYYRHPNQKVN